MNTNERQQSGHTQVTVNLNSAHLELVTDFLAVALPAGFQELDSNSPEIITLRFFLKGIETEPFQRKWESFYQSAFGAPAPALDSTFIPEIDWQERFRQETKAVIVADSILVRPTWIDPESVRTSAISTEIEIDPKMAFGVGSHETTQLAMRALKKNLKIGQRVADIGCGSLILSILAAKLGAKSVRAVDNDPLAIENSNENRRLNQVEDIVEVFPGSTEVFQGEERRYDMVVANILSEILLRLLDDMLQLVRDGGVLILSGILERDAPAIECALRRRRVTDWSRSQSGKWVCYTCSPSRS